MAPTIHNFGGNPMAEGDLLNLTCEAHGGNPLATLGWYRGVEKVGNLDDLLKCVAVVNQ